MENKMNDFNIKISLCECSVWWPIIKSCMKVFTSCPLLLKLQCYQIIHLRIHQNSARMIRNTNTAVYAKFCTFFF